MDRRLAVSVLLAPAAAIAAGDWYAAANLSLLGWLFAAQLHRMTCRDFAVFVPAWLVWQGVFAAVAYGGFSAQEGLEWGLGALLAGKILESYLIDGLTYLWEPPRS